MTDLPSLRARVDGLGVLRAEALSMARRLGLVEATVDAAGRVSLGPVAGQDGETMGRLIRLLDDLVAGAVEDWRRARREAFRYRARKTEAVDDAG